jgi:hypothetical protein
MNAFVPFDSKLGNNVLSASLSIASMRSAEYLGAALPVSCESGIATRCAGRRTTRRIRLDAPTNLQACRLHLFLNFVGQNQIIAARIADLVEQMP